MKILLKPLNHKGTIIPEGSPVPAGLSEEMINKLITNKAAKEVTDPKPSKDNSKNTSKDKQDASKDSNDQQSKETGKE